MDNPSFSPIPRDKLLGPAEVALLLDHDSVAVRIRDKGVFPGAGQKVGVRLNLNVMKTTGQAIQTLHLPTNKTAYRKNKGFYGGEACGYAQAVVLKNAYFNVNQSGREAIATGEHSKFPMASVDGELVGVDPPEDFAGIELRFNPKTHHLFVDANNRAVHCAEEVVILGNRAYARGKISYHTDLTAPPRAGTAPSQAIVEGSYAPHLIKEPGRPEPEGEGYYAFDDEVGRVYGLLYLTNQPDGRREIAILDWQSNDPGHGNADRALRYLRARCDTIRAVGVGEVDEDGVADIPVYYWARQREKGLVDTIILDNGVPFTEDLLGPVKAPAPRCSLHPSR